MIKPTYDISAVRRAVQDCCHKPVTVRLDMGRNRRVTFSATVSGVYPSLFTVAPEDKRFLGKTAYSYSEILCGRVKLRPRPAGKS